MVTYSIHVHIVLLNDNNILSSTLFIILNKVVLTFESVDEILSVTIQMKVFEQYFTVMLFIILNKVVLPFESADEILKCDRSNESYWEVLSCGAVYYAVQGGSNF